MNHDEARTFVLDNIAVQSHHIAVMKSLLVKHGIQEQQRFSAIQDAALKELGVEGPQPRASVDLNGHPEAMLSQMATWISWSVASCEAAWGLLRSGAFVPASESRVTEFRPRFSAQSRGHTSGIDFPEYNTPYTDRIVPSRSSAALEVLCDADLFLKELNVPDIHESIVDSLRESVACFRAGLFTASIVMLGKASEGAWIETGLALLTALPEDEKTVRKRQDWAGPEIGFAKKMRDIESLYSTQQKTFKPVGAAAGVTLEQLRMAMIWSDVLRDTRNVIHHNVSTSINPTREAVATLLLGALPYLRLLHRLAKAAKEIGER